MFIHFKKYVIFYIMLKIISYVKLFKKKKLKVKVLELYTGSFTHFLGLPYVNIIKR